MLPSFEDVVGVCHAFLSLPDVLQSEKIFQLLCFVLHFGSSNKCFYSATDVFIFHSTELPSRIQELWVFHHIRNYEYRFGHQYSRDDPDSIHLSDND